MEAALLIEAPKTGSVLNPHKFNQHTLVTRSRADSSSICNPSVAITDAKTIIP